MIDTLQTMIGAILTLAILACALLGLYVAMNWSRFYRLVNANPMLREVDQLDEHDPDVYLWENDAGLPGGKRSKIWTTLERDTHRERELIAAMRLAGGARKL